MGVFLAQFILRDASCPWCTALSKFFRLNFRKANESKFLIAAFFDRLPRAWSNAPFKNPVGNFPIVHGKLPRDPAIASMRAQPRYMQKGGGAQPHRLQLRLDGLLTSCPRRRRTQRRLPLRPSFARLPERHRLAPWARQGQRPAARHWPCRAPLPVCGLPWSASRGRLSTRSTTAFPPASSSPRQVPLQLQSCRRPAPFRRSPSTSSRCCRPSSQAGCAPRSLRASPCPRPHAIQLPWPSSRPLPCLGPSSM